MADVWKSITDIHKSYQERMIGIEEEKEDQDNLENSPNSREIAP